MICVNYITNLIINITFKGKQLYIFDITLKHIIMSLVTILLVLIVVGVLLWLVNSFIPMDRKIKSILNILVVILVIIWLLNAFGLLDSLSNMRV